MKKFTHLFLIATLCSSSIFAIGGLGLQVGQSSFSVAESSPESGITGVTLTNSSFDGSYVLGGYLYIDAIPFIDLEVDANIRGNTYEINFTNIAGEMNPLQFAWASADVYYTLRKKVFGLSIPFLAGAKIHAGGGMNTHTTSPIASINLIEELLGGDLENGNPDNLADNLESYLKDNAIDATGFHIQAGLQFKLLMLDTFINYRYTIVDDVVPNASGFGSLNFRLGFGI